MNPKMWIKIVVKLLITYLLLFGAIPIFYGLLVIFVRLFYFKVSIGF